MEKKNTTGDIVVVAYQINPPARSAKPTAVPSPQPTPMSSGLFHSAIYRGLYIEM
jgi:hypothetical protein